MLIKISTTNSKLGIIPSVNLPPIITCRPNCPCVKDCYASKGNYRFSNVKNSLTNNYNIYLNNPETYFNEVKQSINNGLVSYSYFRWHAAGDFVDDNYFKNVVRLANELPLTSFLAFTKKYEIVNKYIEHGGNIPDNLHIVFSAWGNKLTINNPYAFPVAYVRFKDENENRNIPNTAIKCSGDCTNCLRCWNIKLGESVVFNKH